MTALLDLGQPVSVGLTTDESATVCTDNDSWEYHGPVASLTEALAETAQSGLAVWASDPQAWPVAARRRMAGIKSARLVALTLGCAPDTPALEIAWRLASAPRPQQRIVEKALALQFYWDRRAADGFRLDDQVVHPVVRVHGTRTGRMTSASPNLQAIALPTLAKRMPPPRGFRYVAADLSAFEPSILAGLSGDEALVTALRGDLYAMLARRCGLERAVAKRFFLATVYGAGPAALSRHSSLELAETQAMQSVIWTCFSRLRDWASAIRRSSGQLTTSDGRTVPAPLHAYQRVNAVAQATAADFFRQSQLQVFRSEASWRPAVAVHDSLLVAVPEDDWNASERLTAALSGSFRCEPIRAIEKEIQ